VIYAWSTHSLDPVFLPAIKQRIFDHALHNLKGLIDSSPKCRVYRYIYDSCTLQHYLWKSVMYAQYITRIRLSAHHIVSKRGDITRIAMLLDIVLCTKTSLKMNFTLSLNDLRKQYIKPYFWKKTFYIQTRPITMYAKSETTQTSWCLYFQSCQTKNHHCEATRCLYYVCLPCMWTFSNSLFGHALTYVLYVLMSRLAQCQ
jgi:hypothetical protein